MSSRVWGVVAAAATLVLGACAPSDETPAERGRRVYLANCTACHNLDPSVEGVMGPRVLGASRDLLEARVLRAGYPAGYTPARETTLMQPLPYLAPEIDALAAYLGPAAGGKPPAAGGGG
jgi:mono/diheme cytochrome c family protein